MEHCRAGPAAIVQMADRQHLPFLEAQHPVVRPDVVLCHDARVANVRRAILFLLVCKLDCVCVPIQAVGLP